MISIVHDGIRQEAKAGISVYSVPINNPLLARSGEAKRVRGSMGNVSREL